MPVIGAADSPIVPAGVTGAPTGVVPNQPAAETLLSVTVEPGTIARMPAPQQGSAHASKLLSATVISQPIVRGSRGDPATGPSPQQLRSMSEAADRLVEAWTTATRINPEETHISEGKNHSPADWQITRILRTLGFDLSSLTNKADELAKSPDVDRSQFDQSVREVCHNTATVAGRILDEVAQRPQLAERTNLLKRVGKFILHWAAIGGLALVSVPLIGAAAAVGAVAAPLILPCGVCCGMGTATGKAAPWWVAIPVISSLAGAAFFALLTAKKLLSQADDLSSGRQADVDATNNMLLLQSVAKDLKAEAQKWNPGVTIELTVESLPTGRAKVTVTPEATATPVAVIDDEGKTSSTREATAPPMYTDNDSDDDWPEYTEDEDSDEPSSPTEMTTTRLAVTEEESKPSSTPEVTATPVSATEVEHSSEIKSPS